MNADKPEQIDVELKKTPNKLVKVQLADHVLSA
jgi:hypothetical protein